MLNGHVDVVPEGDLGAWTGRDAFSGSIVDGALHGRGACDMTAGVVAARWAVRALRASRVPLRGAVLVAPAEGAEDGGLGTVGPPAGRQRVVQGKRGSVRVDPGGLRNIQK